MSGKRAFLDLLKQEGVEIVFGNPGTTELPLMDAFAVENDIRYLLGLQEAALMAMADGYAQASGKLTVLNLHVAPGLGKLTRFLPMVDIDGTIPADLDEKTVRELVILDTFDMFSPEHDHPQRMADVVRMVTDAGAEVTFAGHVAVDGSSPAVVRAIRR